MEESKIDGDAPPQTGRGGTSDDSEDNAGSVSYALNFEGLPTGLTTDDMRDLIRHFNDVVEVFVIRETNDRGTTASAIFKSKGAAQSARSAISSIGDSPTISTVGDGDNEGPSPNLMCASLQNAAAYFHKGLLTWTKIESRSQPGPKEDGGVPRATTIQGTAWTGDIRHADMAAVGRSLSRVREIITTNRHIWELVTFDVLGSGALRLHKALRKAFFKHSNIKRQLDTIHERSTADSGHGLAIDIRPVDDQTEAAIRTCNTCATVIRRSALGLAAESGEIGALCVMLERGEDVNVSDPPTSAHCRTALHWAAFGNNEVVIELLVEAGASVQAVGKGHESPLHVSAERSALEAARALLKHGADSNATDAFRQTPLHKVASTQGEVGMVVLLLDSGSDPTIKDANGQTAADVVGADVQEHDRSKEEMDVLRRLLASAPVTRDDSA